METWLGPFDILLMFKTPTEMILQKKKIVTTYKEIKFYVTFVANLNISRITRPILMLKMVFESLFHTLSKY